MKMPRRLLLLFTMLSSLVCLAEDDGVTGVTFSTSNTIAPYFTPDGQGGIQYDLLKTALESQGMAITFINLAPNLRALRQVESNVSDCLINAPGNLPNLYYTRSLIEYQNSVFSLTASKLPLESLEDLQAVSLVGFQNADRYLGKEFTEKIKSSPNYSVTSSQRNQVAMLFNHRADAIVMERRIFNYYRQKMRKHVDTELPVTESRIFKPAPRRIACRDAILASRIDRAIQQLKQSQDYARIIAGR